MIAGGLIMAAAGDINDSDHEFFRAAAMLSEEADEVVERPAILMSNLFIPTLNRSTRPLTALYSILFSGRYQKIYLEDNSGVVVVLENTCEAPSRTRWLERRPNTWDKATSCP
jgi:hypothetical protein